MDQIRPYLRKCRPAAKSVLLWLWTYADFKRERFEAWPTAADVADALGFDLRSVRRSLKELEKMGAIDVEAKGVRVKRMLNRGCPVSHPGTSEQVTDGSGGGDRRVRGGVTDGSAPTLLESPIQSPINLQEISPVSDDTEQLALVPPIPETDELAEAWEYFSRCRKAVMPKSRVMRFTSDRRSALKALTRAGYSSEDIRTVISSCARSVHSDASQGKWFNGSTPFVAKNFSRALSGATDGDLFDPDNPGSKSEAAPAHSTDVRFGSVAPSPHSEYGNRS